MLGDGGIETDLIFHHGLDLPHFASFVLLGSDDGRQALRGYYLDYLQIAQESRVGIVLESATWRANPDWGELLGYGSDGLSTANRAAVDLLVALRDQADPDVGPIIISGCVGPRIDGYDPVTAVTETEAQAYHAAQVEVFAESAADLVTAITMAYPAEAVGIVRAAQAAGIPVVVSFTVETDGRLPDGTALRDAIQVVDQATGTGAAYFMVNCAHPSHLVGTFDPVSDATGSPDWVTRIRGLRLNASARSHTELDAAEDLDEGDPKAFGAGYARLRAELPHLTVLGGCCGTDHRHIREVAKACLGAVSRAVE